MAWTKTECVKCMAENEIWIDIKDPIYQISVETRNKCDGHCRKENHEDRNK
jgi:hypothetical protein